MSEVIHTGGCFCGAVRFQAVGEPMNVRVCHCTPCQRAMAAPFYSRALFRKDAVSWTGRTEFFLTSANVRRHFCPTCGTRLFTEGINAPPRYGIGLGALDDPDALPPTEHIFVSTKLAWVKLDDGLPQYQERAPA